MAEAEFQFVRGHLIDNLSVLEYHKRTVDMIKNLDEQIEKLSGEAKAPEARQFKNPRQEAIYLHDVKTLTVLMRQRERLKQKLVEIQERLQGDIDASKKVTPLKPLKKLQ